MSATPLDTELDKISDRIRFWREERGLSRQELAELSGVAASTVHKVETRQMTPSIAVVLKLAHGLGRRPAEIMAEGVADLHCTMCGLGPVAIVMEAAKALGADTATMLAKANSGDVPGGDQSRCVGYAAVAFTGPYRPASDETLETWRNEMRAGYQATHKGEKFSAKIAYYNARIAEAERELRRLVLRSEKPETGDE